MNKDEEPIVVEQTYSVSIETVWSAITEADQMRQWYFDNIPDFQPEVGFETRFEVHSGERNFPHVWKVTEVKSAKLIEYNWQYDNYPGDSFVTFELSGEGETTKLRLTHRTTESFPEDIPEFKRESGVAGWTYFIQQSLKDYLENSGG